MQSIGFARALTRQADDDFSDQLLCSFLGQTRLALSSPRLVIQRSQKHTYRRPGASLSDPFHHFARHTISKTRCPAQTYHFPHVIHFQQFGFNVNFNQQLYRLAIDARLTYSHHGRQ